MIGDLKNALCSAPNMYVANVGRVVANNMNKTLEELLSYVGEIPDEYGERSKIVHEDVFKDGVAHLTPELFEQIYCNTCGTQRCEGINSEWFDGCKFKDHLNR